MKTYYIDRIRINSKKEMKLLKRSLPIEQLKKHCRKLMLRKSTGKGSFLSCVDIVAPDVEFFRTLESYDNDLAPYAISYIEIAKDANISRNKADLCCRKMFDTMYLRKAKKHVIYDVHTKAGWYAIPLRDPDLFGTATMYTGSKEFKMVVYPRNSKITGEPVIHEEFRLNRQKNIIQRTGIELISDCVNFDLGEWFEENYQRYVRHETIDITRLGLWYRGWTRKKNLTKKQIGRAQLTGRTFIACHKQIKITYENGDTRFYENNINTYGGLIAWLKNKKKSIRHMTGRKNEFENKILKLQNYDYFKRNNL